MFLVEKVDTVNLDPCGRRRVVFAQEFSDLGAALRAQERSPWETIVRDSDYNVVSANTVAKARLT